MSRGRLSAGRRREKDLLTMIVRNQVVVLYPLVVTHAVGGALVMVVPGWVLTIPAPHMGARLGL